MDVRHKKFLCFTITSVRDGRLDPRLVMFIERFVGCDVRVVGRDESRESSGDRSCGSKACEVRRDVDARRMYAGRATSEGAGRPRPCRRSGMRDWATASMVSGGKVGWRRSRKRDC